MSIISREMSGDMRYGTSAGKMSFVSLLSSLVFLLLVACDFNGPWNFYPEETEIYAGVYTYGYIVEGEYPNVCFAKVYQLEEASAENFAFYDSAYITITDLQSEKEYEAVPGSDGDPNCFSNGLLKGVSGDSYRLDAFFKWDSAGETVKSKFSAVATIPSKFGLKGLNIPQQDGGYKSVEYEGQVIEYKFVEYPYDMNLVKFAMDYDETVGGVVLSMDYDLENGGENMNTTINDMLGGMIEKDSMGYTKVSMHDALESRTYLGFEENRFVAGYYMLDSIMATNLTFPVGKTTLHFYATDKAYVNYNNDVMGAIEDPRIVPKSNIEGGMGVFSGMKRLDLDMNVTSGDFVKYDHIAAENCKAEVMGSKSWDTKSCRLFQDVYCSGMKWEDLVEANKEAMKYYEEGEYKQEKTCYGSNVKAAMFANAKSWSAYLPEEISDADKSAAYGDGLKRYCVASNFESNDIADCRNMYNDCQVSDEKTDCKEYLWQWCADREWNITLYPQCGTAIVSRYYIEEQKSSVLEKVVDNWCHDHKDDKQCRK